MQRACTHVHASLLALCFVVVLLNGDVYRVCTLQVVVISDDDDEDDCVRVADKLVSKPADSASVNREPASGGSGWRVPKHAPNCSSIIYIYIWVSFTT